MVVIFKRMVVTTWFIGDRKAILPWMGFLNRPKAPGDPGGVGGGMPEGTRVPGGFQRAEMGLGGLERPGAAGGQPSLRGGESPPWPGRGRSTFEAKALDRDDLEGRLERWAMKRAGEERDRGGSVWMKKRRSRG